MLNPEARRGQRHSGQLKNRVEELKNRWRPSSPLVFNYNETARLATDALVEQGEKGYLSVLQDEKELPFLSSLDTEYICTSKPNEIRTSEKECDGTDSLLDGHCPSELTSGTYFPYMSDIDAPDLELGWPEIPLATKARKTEVQVFFQKHRTSEIKELVRSHINMAKKVIAVVMDLFTDVDILCDLFEAARKRRVPVYILLDEKNLVYFIEMYEKLGLNKMSLENMKIRTVTGDTYCTKSGKKFSGQCMEKFIMTDCEHVIAGSYSFSWLASHVHSNMVTYFKGSIVEEFDREFRCLYADSLEDKYFNNMENDNNKSFTQGFGNRWPPSKPPTVQPQVLECRSLSNSDSSSDSQSSVKTPPFANHQANTIIHEGKVLSSNPIAKKENEDQVKSKVVSNTDRRQSDPDTDIKNLHIMQTSPLSRSSPILNEKSFLQSTPQGTNRVSGLQRFLHSDNKTSPRMRSEMALNNVPNGAGVEIKMDTILKNGKNEVKGIDPKRMTLGHSKLDLITQYSNMPKKIFSRFGNN
ncbi:hypothetical protein GDO86_014326 [Hymenochirus boettgeri]|uniref:Scaffolding anchor of CK1 domain-containing protein n=1 Tax=Hymenochirus boettgeri TaxID=247094 RepID=A0A8T2JWU9_9PIPI|nr:hypothetical protein GDO86_014326 [Hymenochirus boettgeri]